MLFDNRVQAGRWLSTHLAFLKDDKPIVLGLPKGGVPVANEIAKFLKAPLDVLIVRKIGAPLQPELAVGAIGEDEEPLFNENILEQLDLNPEDLVPIIQEEIHEIHRQIDAFRRGRTPLSVHGKTVIVVDDGLATGATAHAAIQYLKKKGAQKIVVAIPIAAKNSADYLRTKADEVVAFEESEDLLAVGYWYKDFSQVTDMKVISILDKALGHKKEHGKPSKPTGPVVRPLF